MSIISKTDELDKIVTLASLSSSFFSNDAQLFEEVRKSIEAGSVSDSQITEIKRTIEQADRTSLATFTSIVR